MTNVNPDFQNSVTTSVQGESLLRLNWEGRDFQLKTIDVNHFVVACDPMVRAHDPNRANPVCNGTITSDQGEDLPVLFRVVGTHDRLARCAFYNLSEGKQQRIEVLMSKLTAMHAARQRQQQKERQAEQASTAKPPSETRPSTKTPRSATTKSSGRKWLLAGLAGALLFGFLMLKGPKDITLSNAVANGDKFAVLAPESGDVVDLMVKVGDDVRQGDLLARIAKPANSDRLNAIDAEIEKTKAEVESLSNQQINKSDPAKTGDGDSQTSIIDPKITAVEKEIETFTAKVKAGEDLLRKLAPLIADDNIPAMEVKEIRGQLSANIAMVEKKQTELKQVKLAYRQSQANSPNRQLLAAKAKLKRLEETRDSLVATVSPVDLRSPRDGTVHAIHLAKGESLSAAATAFDLAVADATWATGYIDSNQSNQVKPGQLVSITIPSSGATLSGKVTSLGVSPSDRADESGDMSNSAVPVQVALVGATSQLVPGETLEMSIKTSQGLNNWVRGIFGRSGQEKTKPDSNASAVDQESI